MIEVVGVSKWYGEHPALSDVTFKVEKGSIVGFLGANGAGKTTTMDILCGCIGADAGSTKIAGFDITENPIEAKKRLGYLPDTPPLYPEMRVIEHISFAANLHGLKGPALRDRLATLMKTLELEDVAQRLVGNLSKGYRQRVALAQALIHDPEVLVLDEPTEGLDPNQIAHIRELIRALKGQHTIILSSHILSEVESICDSIVIINKGKIVTQGTYAELAKTFSAAGSVYRLKVARQGASLSEKLASFSEVNKIESNGDNLNDFNLYLADNQQEAALDKIGKLVVTGDYGLRELTPQTKSLEDIFIQITH